MKQKKPIPAKWILLLAGICVALSVFCYAGKHVFTDSGPFASDYIFEGPSGVFPGANGNVFVIDKGKKSVLKIDGSGQILRIISGGIDSDNQFYYASQVAEGTDGCVYIADARYASKGTIIKEERIFRYSAMLEDPVKVYSIDYTDSDSPPMQYGNIKSLYERDGSLVFAVKTVSGVDVRVLNEITGETTSVSYALPGEDLSDVVADPITLRPMFVDRLGKVCSVNEEGAVEVLSEDTDLAWNLCTDGSAIYYTDLTAKSLMRLDMATGEKTAVLTGESVLFTARMQDGRVCTTDYVGYYELSGGEARYTDTLAFSTPVLRYALWAALCLDALALLTLLYIVCIRPQIGKKKTLTFQRTMIALSVSVCMSALVTCITLGRTVDTQNKSIMEQLNLCTDVMIQASDVEALQRVRSSEDYRSSDYEAVKQPLDDIMDMTYENGLYYYYAIYVTDGSTIYALMDYENTVAAWYPMYDWGTEGYTDVLATGDTINVSADVSSYGSWSFVLKPILDNQGKPVAIMEVGTNLDDLNAQTNALLFEIILTVVSMSIVLLMLILEMIFYIEHRETRSRIEQTSGGDYLRFPLRTLAFLTFLADCMQDPFVSILANRLYTPMWGIPQSLGAALPLSAQVLTAAVSAFVCGNLVRRLGTRRMMGAGFAVQIAGFVLCAAAMNYLGLLCGKAVIGLGMGAIIVSINSVSAAGKTEKEGAEAFAAINAGTLAGITVGAGVGSVILSFLNFSAVYYAGAAILLIGLFITLTGADYKERTVERAGKGMDILKLLADRSIWPFLLLVLTPFLIAISFREYFFPIYAAESGIDETNIGRIYLLCGLFVIYVGPPLTKSFISRLGGKWTVVLAGALITAATLLFGLIPTLPAAVIGLMLLSVAISFGYAAQSTYYAGLPRVSEYGESRAMGVYSLFDNGGQTLGPILYGAALLMGYRQGVLLIGAALLALLLLFVAVTVNKRVGIHKGKGRKTDYKPDLPQ